MDFLRKLALVAGAMMATCAIAQTNPLWMRFCAISPDGQTIAFSYKGDIFTVPVQGGVAHQVTSNDAYDACPVWSPNGQHIAFASAREGSMDVYLIGKVIKKLSPSDIVSFEDAMRYQRVMTRKKD